MKHKLVALVGSSLLSVMLLGACNDDEMDPPPEDNGVTDENQNYEPEDMSNNNGQSENEENENNGFDIEDIDEMGNGTNGNGGNSPHNE